MLDVASGWQTIRKISCRTIGGDRLTFIVYAPLIPPGPLAAGGFGGLGARGRFAATPQKGIQSAVPWDHLGAILGLSWVFLERLVGILRASWAHFGAILVRWGILGPSWGYVLMPCG